MLQEAGSTSISSDPSPAQGHNLLAAAKSPRGKKSTTNPFTFRISTRFLISSYDANLEGKYLLAQIQNDLLKNARSGSSVYH